MLRFGANDAAVGQNCSVPPEEFQSNLNAIISHLKAFFQHIVVLSPTPVDGERRLVYQRERFGDNATGVLERTTERAGQYRDLASAVAKSNNVMFLDLLHLMHEKNEKQAEDVNWRSYLNPDGLHLSALGQSFVAAELVSLVEDAGLGQDTLPHDYFPWQQQASPGDEADDKYGEVMDHYEHQMISSARMGQGLEMPSFPILMNQNAQATQIENMSPHLPNFEQCGVTLTTLSTLDAFFQHKPQVQILGFGSLMSEQSARTTFPHLTNFRIVRVQGYRRVFRHPAAIFFERGIADMESLQIASLSAEKQEGSSFIASVFSIEGETGENFLKREEEFDFHMVPFTSCLKDQDNLWLGEVEKERENKREEEGEGAGAGEGVGLMCVGGTDAHYVARWGQATYAEKYLSRGLQGVWNWRPDSGLLPCAVYLRHCYLSAKKLTSTHEIFDSFLNETYLCDRVTTVGEYLAAHPDVLTTLPPESLADRYGGS